MRQAIKKLDDELVVLREERCNHEWGSSEFYAINALINSFIAARNLLARDINDPVIEIEYPKGDIKNSKFGQCTAKREVQVSKHETIEMDINDVYCEIASTVDREQFLSLPIRQMKAVYKKLGELFHEQEVKQEARKTFNQSKKSARIAQSEADKLKAERRDEPTQLERFERDVELYGYGGVS